MVEQVMTDAERQLRSGRHPGLRYRQIGYTPLVLAKDRVAIDWFPSQNELDLQLHTQSKRLGTMPNIIKEMNAAYAARPSIISRCKRLCKRVRVQYNSWILSRL